MNKLFSQISNILLFFYKALRMIVRRFIAFYQKRGKSSYIIVLIAKNVDANQQEEILQRLTFFVLNFNQYTLIQREKISLTDILSSDAILIFGSRGWLSKFYLEMRPGTFDIDFNLNPKDGWAWTGLTEFLSDEIPDLIASKNLLRKKIKSLRKKNLPRCYIFGTGPSLENADQRSWSDGYKIVCNTIVRDPELWNYLQPDFIVAGDALYHFGDSKYAKAFRSDLRARLQETDTFFVYPSQFHAIVWRELSEFTNQLVPISTGWRKRIDIDLTKDFSLPNLGNVLGLLLLPLACTLSKEIFLWGFDGRAPNDKLFWSNSKRHSYPEFIPELQKEHPKFFSHYVPESDPNKYVRSVQGDSLDLCLGLAGKKGWKFTMMHKSWTPILQKRYSGEQK